MDRTDEPKRRGRKPQSDTPSLGFKLYADVAKRLRELQDSVRYEAGHPRPNQQTLVSALILNETRRGEDLEQELLVPFRLSHPNAD